MSNTIVDHSFPVVNPFESFKRKAKKYGQAVNAEKVEVYNDGDQYVAIIRTNPETRLYARPHSMKILAKIFLSSGYTRTIEIC